MADKVADGLRALHLRGALGAVRTIMHDGRETLVIPVVALKDGVIHAINAATPERVTTQLLQRAAHTWNGRPLTLGHPAKNGVQVSANEPHILESQAFGTIFNSRVEGDRLMMDAYIDVQKALRVGGAKFLENIKAGKMCEVSVGAFVKTDPTPGDYNGKPYKAMWLESFGDHLAFLPDGVGACSIAMGCGALRAAQAAEELVIHEVTDTEFKALIGNGNVGGNPCDACEGFGELKALIGSGNVGLKALVGNGNNQYTRDNPTKDREVSDWGPDDESRRALKIEPKDYVKRVARRSREDEDFDGLSRHNANRLVRTLRKIKTNDVRQVYREALKRRGFGPRGRYSTSQLIYDDIAIIAYETLKERNIDPSYIASAEPRRRNLEAQVTALAKYEDCPACKGSGNVNGNPCDACEGSGELKVAEAAEHQGEISMKKEEAIKVLTGCKCSGFTAADTKLLEAFPEERLTALAEATQARAAESDKAKKMAEELEELKKSSKTKDEELETLRAAAAKVPTEEEYLAKAPQSIRTLVERQKAQDAATKDTLVGQLKTAQSVYTEDELKGMEIPQLEKLAALAKIERPVDYSGRALPRVLSQKTDDYTPPNPYEEGLKALAAAGK